MPASPWAEAQPALPWIALVLGLLVGSFANVLIHRLPLELSVVRPRSRCPACGAAIAALDNVPILSYLLLLGRCRACRAPISPRYPAVEAANGVAYLALVWCFGPAPRTLLLMAFVSALLALSVIDFDHHLLPDAITLPGLAVGLAASFLPRPPGPGPIEAFATAAAAFLTFAGLAWSWRRLRGIEALGQGDWKLVAMLGAFLGRDKTLLTVFAASLLGTLVGLAFMRLRGKSWQYRMPFGTFLGLAAIAVVFVGDPTLRWYRELFEP